MRGKQDLSQWYIKTKLTVQSYLDKDEPTLIAREIISTLIWSLFNSDETIKFSNEESSPNFDQTKTTKENKLQISNDDYEDGANDESEIKLQEMYVLTLTVIGVILFGVVFGMLLKSLDFNTQIGFIKSIR